MSGNLLEICLGLNGLRFFVSFFFPFWHFIRLFVGSATKTTVTNLTELNLKGKRFLLANVNVIIACHARCSMLCVVLCTARPKCRFFFYLIASRFKVFLFILLVVYIFIYTSEYMLSTIIANHNLCPSWPGLDCSSLYISPSRDMRYRMDFDSDPNSVCTHFICFLYIIIIKFNTMAIRSACIFS